MKKGFLNTSVRDKRLELLNRLPAEASPKLTTLITTFAQNRQCMLYAVSERVLSVVCVNVAFHQNTVADQ